MKTLIVTPTTREASALGDRAHAFVCGTGQGARDSLAARLRTNPPKLVVLAGYCGGLDPSLGPGSVILGRQVAKAGRPTLEPDRFLVEDVRNALRNGGLAFVFAKLLGVDAPVATLDEKRDLWNEHGAAGVDMETYQAVSACVEARIKWLAVRVVIDGAGQSLPSSLREWAQDGDERAIGRRSARHPSEWPGYVRLGMTYPRARAALKQATVRTVRAAAGARNVETLDLLEVTR